MRTDILKDVLARRNQVLWLLLAFQAGFINTGGFLACHRFVSHMTGYGTYVGVAFGEGRYLGAFEMALAPLFFLSGAMFAGWLVDRRILLGQEPRIRAGIVAMAVLNLAIFLEEITDFAGTFGEPLERQRNYLLLFALCFACGLQNGLFTTLTKGQVRTTHLTGPTTDIGLNITKALTMGRGHPEYQQTVLMNVLRIKIAIAFSSGALIATPVFRDLTFQGFAIPAAISLFLVGYVHMLLKIGGGESQDRQPQALLVPGDLPGRASGG